MPCAFAITIAMIIEKATGCPQEGRARIFRRHGLAQACASLYGFAVSRQPSAVSRQPLCGGKRAGMGSLQSGHAVQGNQRAIVQNFDPAV